VEPEGFNWFHSIRFPDGHVTPGYKGADALAREAELIFRFGVAGASVLDIGAYDGYFSFEAERRGAARVLATDHFGWSGPGLSSKAPFDYAHARLNSKVESLDRDVFALEPKELGQFDVVIMLGVLYHLKDMIGGLERAGALTRNLLVVETQTAMNTLPFPLARCVFGGHLGGDHTNYWVPNVACVKRMLTTIGFKRFEAVHSVRARRPFRDSRTIIHAWR
jgi:tRNA (mo5U34)-methyltransferase